MKKLHFFYWIVLAGLAVFLYFDWSRQHNTLLTLRVGDAITIRAQKLAIDDFYQHYLPLLDAYRSVENISVRVKIDALHKQTRWVLAASGRPDFISKATVWNTVVDTILNDSTERLLSMECTPLSALDSTRVLAAHHQALLKLLSQIAGYSTFEGFNINTITDMPYAKVGQPYDVWIGLGPRPRDIQTGSVFSLDNQEIIPFFDTVHATLPACQTPGWQTATITARSYDLYFDSLIYRSRKIRWWCN